LGGTPISLSSRSPLPANLAIVVCAWTSTGLAKVGFGSSSKIYGERICCAIPRKGQLAQSRDVCEVPRAHINKRACLPDVWLAYIAARRSSLEANVTNVDRVRPRCQVFVRRPQPPAQYVQPASWARFTPHVPDGMTVIPGITFAVHSFAASSALTPALPANILL